MIPIIFIHNRNNDYLPLSLWKARATNPNSEVILLGDGQNAHFGAFVKHDYQSKYFKKAAQLAKTFQNFSSNPHGFELICLQRWMILEEYLKTHQIENCLYIDSDVLLFDDIQTDAERFSANGMTVAGISGHSNFIYKTATLSAFCNYILESYSDEAALTRAEKKYQTFCQTHAAGGISDMTYFSEFRATQTNQVLDIGVPIDAKMFDITITYTKEMCVENGIKKLKWEAQKPFAEFLNGQTVEMRSLHFQGESKKYMRAMARIDSTSLNVIYKLNAFYLLIQKVWNKING